MSAPVEMVDRWGEVHTVTWDADLGQWVGEVQGTGVNGKPLRASWPRDALKPWLAPSAAHQQPGQATSDRAKIPVDEIPF